MRVAPFNVESINKVFYAGQSGFPSIQSAVNAAHAAGGGQVALQTGVSVTDTIGAVSGFTDVGIQDARVTPNVQYVWIGSGPYTAVSNVTPGGVDGSVQYRTGATLGGDSLFTYDGTSVNLLGKRINLKKADGTGTAYLIADGDASSIDLNGSLKILSSWQLTAVSADPNWTASNLFAWVNSSNSGSFAFTGSAPGTYGSLSVTARDSAGTVGAGFTLSQSGGFNTGTTFINTQTGYRVNGVAGAGQYLRGDGTNFTAGTIQAGDVPTLNQNTTGTASNVTGVVGITNGGTGAGTAAGARAALGLGSMATQNANAVNITGGSILMPGGTFGGSFSKPLTSQAGGFAFGNSGIETLIYCYGGAPGNYGSLGIIPVDSNGTPALGVPTVNISATQMDISVKANLGVGLAWFNTGTAGSYFRGNGSLYVPSFIQGVDIPALPRIVAAAAATGVTVATGAPAGTTVATSVATDSAGILALTIGGGGATANQALVDIAFVTPAPNGSVPLLGAADANSGISNYFYIKGTATKATIYASASVAAGTYSFNYHVIQY